jgi:hypothetical protein
MIMRRRLTVFSATILAILQSARTAWAVQSDGSLGANFIAALVNASTGVWLPAMLALGFLVVIGMMLFGQGGRFIQKFGYWILAILLIGGGFVYFSGFAGGNVSMTFLV